MTIFLLFLIGVVLITSQARNPSLFIALSAGYTVNIILIFTQRYVRPIFHSSDQQRFLDLANDLAAVDFVSFLFAFDPTSSYVISWFAALVFKVFGGDILYVNFFFVHAWLGTIIFSSKLSLLITNSRKASFLIALFLISIPSVSIVNAAFLRESFIIFFLVASVYHSFKWYVFKSRWCFFKSIFFMALAGLFHGVFYFFCIFLALFYVKENILKARIRYFDVLLLFAFLPILAVASIKLADNVKIKMAFDLIAGEKQSIERFLSAEEKNDQEGINRLPLPALDGSSSISFMIGVVKKVAAFSSSPFVHQYYKITDVPRIYDSIIFLIIWGLCLASYVGSRGRSDDRIRFYFRFFVPMILLLMLMFSLGSFDVGTGHRHRLKFMPVFMVVTCSIYYVTRVLSRTDRQKKSAQR